MLSNYFPTPFLDEISWFTILSGGTAYVLIYLMLLTSFEYVESRMSTGVLSAIHVFGAYYLLVSFANSYIPRAIENMNYIPFAVALIVAVLLRINRSYIKYAITATK